MLCALLAACEGPDLDPGEAVGDAASEVIGPAPTSCADVPTDATATLSSGEASEILQSAGSLYIAGHRICKRFVADFRVASDLAPPPSHTSEFVANAQARELGDGTTTDRLNPVRVLQSPGGQPLTGVQPDGSIET